MSGGGGRKRSLGAFLEEEVLPRLFERLDQAFPEFGWEATQDGWVATNRDTTKRVLDARPERVICNRPFGFYAHGGQSLTWVAYLNGGRVPRGQAFLETARKLCDLAGVPFPDREVSAEELRAIQEAEGRRTALEAVIAIVQRAYASEVAAPARAYVRERGLDDAQASALGLGFYPSVADVRRALRPELHAVAKDAGLLWDKLEGYVLFPWLDDWGRPLTLYGRWQGKAPPDGRPKTVALPGSGTKRSPLYFDRARAACARDLVLVEGVLDAAVLQARGETRVVACVGAQLSRAQVETLVRHRVSSVTICLDPDGAGEKGTLSCLRALGEAGVAAYVAPRLPDGLDPDELVLRDGLPAWRAHVGRALAGPRWRAERALEGVTPSSPDLDRDRAIREVGEVAASLRGSSAERERDELLRLLAKATGSRVGALRAELPAPAGAAAEESPKEKGRPEVTVWPYREEERGLVWVKERFGQDGSVEFEEVPLANFAARITGEVREDDGAEERRFFEITGRVGKRSRSFQIASSQFNGLAWAVEELGANAILEPGPWVKDRMRHAIQTISGDPPRQTVFTHLGWRRVGGQWLYLHAGGAIGSQGPVEDVSVRLEEPLDRFALPAPPEGEALADAVWGWMRVLEVAPKRITVPLFAMVCRAILGDTDFSGHLYGGTGNFKSCVAALFQQAFGAGLHHKNLPGSWESSANALEGLLFLAKDVLLVIDDFVPTGSPNEQARRHRDADRVIRGQGNRTGRQRMRPDASLRPVRRSRSLVLGTGEELPRGESLTARMLVMPVAPGDVNVDALTRCQAEAAAGVYARATAGFVRWLAGRYSEVQQGLQAEQAELRAQVLEVGGHRRSAEIAASLLVGLRWFTRFLEASGLYPPSASRSFLEAARSSVLEAFSHQTATQRDSDPTTRFFELLASALASGRAHVASPLGKVPGESPLAWGWRLGGEGRPEREPWKPGGSDDEPYWHPQGERIGWVEGEDLFLEPQASHAMAQRVAADEGYPLSPRSLRRRLKDAGLLRTLPNSRETCSVRVSLSGARRSVLHVDAGLLNGVERVPEELFAHG